MKKQDRGINKANLRALYLAWQVEPSDPLATMEQEADAFVAFATRNHTVVFKKLVK